MKCFARVVIALVAVCGLVSCVERLDHTHYRLECEVDSSLGTDSVSLFLLEDAYNRICHVATVARDTVAGSFVIEGQIEQPCVAMLKFSNDSTPFYFVLQQGVTTIGIGARSLVVSGGDINHEYMAYLKARNSLLAMRRAVRAQYLSAAAPDSIISLSDERRFAMRDSLLADSLERVTLEAINRGNAASRIIFDRYVGILRPARLRKVQLMK